LDNLGSAGTVAVVNGTHAISAPLEIAGGNLAILLSGSGALSISGGISDDNHRESLTLEGDGSGQLVLSGSNSFGGGTIVEAGTLIVNNSAALPDGTSLTVGAGGTLIIGSAVAGSVVEGSAIASSPALAPAAVPEPSTVSLLLAAALLAGGLRRRRNWTSRG